MSPDRLIAVVSSLGDAALRQDWATLTAARRHGLTLTAATPGDLCPLFRRLEPQARLFPCDDAVRRPSLDMVLWLARGAFTPWVLLLPAGDCGLDGGLDLPALAHDNPAALIVATQADGTVPWVLLRRAFALRCAPGSARFGQPGWSETLVAQARPLGQSVRAALLPGATAAATALDYQSVPLRKEAP